jgi:hypothetical protein
LVTLWENVNVNELHEGRRIVVWIVSRCDGLFDDLVIIKNDQISLYTICCYQTW